MRIFFSVGETSGDQHAARLIAELRRMEPKTEIRGLGGDRMVEAGMECDFNTVHRSVMFLHSLKRIPELRGVLRRTAAIFEDERPDLVVLVDSVGFNVYVASEANKRGIPVIYYISPQLWAHGSWRVKKIRRLVDKVLVIYPFEVDFYAKHNVPVSYVGHPLFDQLGNESLDEDVLARLRPGEGRRNIAILPGSRRQEIANLLPILLDAARRIRAKVDDVDFHIACSGSERTEQVRRICGQHGADLPIEVGKASEVISTSSLCLTSSGTATLQVAYYLKPMVIVYQVSALFYFFAKPFVTTPFIGLANVLAGKQIVPEFVLIRPRVDLIADAAIEFLTDAERYGACVRDLTDLRDRVALPGASQNAAREILEFVRT